MTENIKKRLRGNKKVDKFTPAPKRIRKPPIDPKVRQQRQKKKDETKQEMIDMILEFRHKKIQKDKKRREMIGIYKRTVCGDTDHEYGLEYVNDVLEYVDVLEDQILKGFDIDSLNSKVLLHLTGYIHKKLRTWESKVMATHLTSLDMMTSREGLREKERQQLKNFFLEVWGQLPIAGVPMEHASDATPLPSQDKEWHAQALHLLKGCPSINTLTHARKNTEETLGCMHAQCKGSGICLLHE